MGNEGWHVASARNLASGVGPLRWQPCAQGRGELALLWRLLPLVGVVACGRLLVRTGRVSGALWRGGGQEGQPGLQTSWGLPSERVCHLAHVFTLSNCFSLLGKGQCLALPAVWLLPPASVRGVGLGALAGMAASYQRAWPGLCCWPPSEQSSFKLLLRLISQAWAERCCVFLSFLRNE